MAQVLTVPQLVQIASKDPQLFEALKQMIQHNNELNAELQALKKKVGP